jgi:hypothetical protein
MKRMAKYPAWRSWAAGLWLCAAPLSAQTILFTGGIIHTVGQGTITNGTVLVQSNKIIGVYDPAKGESAPAVPTEATVINLNGQQL